jgi:ADP-ribosylglycohydrolase
MALCLANSLIVCQDFVPYDQLVRYKWWYRNGYMSSTGHCFDIGAATRQSIQEFEARQRKLAQDCGISFDDMDFSSNPDLFGGLDVYCSKDGVAGNGALMRLAPVPLFFYRNPIKAVEYSGISGQITHGDKKAYDACRYYGALIVATLNGVNKADLTSNTFYQDNKQWFGNDDLHPDIINIAQGSYKKDGGYKDGIRGKGYIVNALEAALWAFWSDENSFEKGVLNAVNLGDDTDTTAAIYGQLAGAYYGYNKLPSKWRDVIYAKDFVLCVSNWIAYEGEQWFNKQNVPSSPEPLVNSSLMDKKLNTTISSSQKSYPSTKYQSSFTGSMGQNTMAIIERKAINPSARIGSLYDVYRDCLVEPSYVNLSLNKNQVRSLPDRIIKIERGEKIECQNLLQFIGFDDDLRLSLVSNIVNPTGIASVIEYPYLIDECTRVFYYSYTIRQEYFPNDFDNIRKHIEQSSSKAIVTHVITAIDFGIDIIVILRLTSSDSNIIDDTLNKIEQSLNNNTILSDKISLDGIVSTHIYSNINDLTKQKSLIDIYQTICQIKNTFDVYQS